MLCGALLIALCYQLPVAHRVDVGGYDAAYTQNFHESERADARNAGPLLAGLDGRARWTKASSFLLFPQIGLPAELTLRLRANPALPAGSTLRVLLNGTTELGLVAPTGDWAEYRFAITNGLIKPSDLVVELRGPVAALSATDARQAGALLDQATLRTTSWPITPYPGQLALGALAAGLLALLVADRRPPTADRRWNVNRNMFVVLGTAAIALAWLLLYRVQLPYSYPLRRMLPVVDLLLAALLALRFGPALVQRWPAVLDVATLGGIGAWTAALLLTAQQHVTRSLPGVETDFSVFAGRSAQLLGRFQPSGKYDPATDGVLRADGFYNLGYPLLLWLVRPLTSGNPFLAARLVAAASAALLLLAAWWLARQLIGRAGGLIAVLALALSPIVVEYGLYVGTDMPFAALCTLALALLVKTCQLCGAADARLPSTADRSGNNRRSSSLLLIGAGLAAGGAFLMRHPGMLLLPFGVCVIGISLAPRDGRRFEWNALLRSTSLTRALGAFALAFLIAILPQLVVNLRDTSSLLFNQQAKNIWLAVYANSEFARVNEAPNSIPLTDVVLADPARFFTNWAANLRGFVGAGGEDVSEFGRADQLRLLAFPLNWLALAGFGGWAMLAVMKTSRQADKITSSTADDANLVRLRPFPLALLGWVALYAVGVAVGLSNLRFVLPLAPVYALAAAWATMQLVNHTIRTTHYALRSTLTISLVLLAFTWGNFGVGAGYVLGNQPANDAAAVVLVQRTLKPNERVLVELPARVVFDKYSAISHLVATPDQINRATYRLRPEAAGKANASDQLIDSAGGYTLYRTNP